MDKRELRRRIVEVRDDDRASYWYWRGWEIALGGAIPVSPSAEMYVDDTSLQQYYEMGKKDAKGEDGLQ